MEKDEEKGSRKQRKHLLLNKHTQLSKKKKNPNKLILTTNTVSTK